jgi:hypothetical protein
MNVHLQLLILLFWLLLMGYLLTIAVAAWLLG